MNRPVMSRSQRTSALLIAFCLALAACSDSGDESTRPQPTTTNVPTSTTTPEDPDEQALRQLAEDWNAASRSIYIDGSIEISTAEGYLVDPYLAGFTEQVESYRSQGRTSRAGDASRHVVEAIEVDGDRATVTECIVDAEVLMDDEGVVINDSILSSRFDTTAVRTAGGWRFEERSRLGEQQEGDSCPD